MTFAARKVLDDCRLAVDMLDEEEDLRRWRVLWFGALAQLRAVGHVLDKVDGTDPATKQISSRHFRNWKSGTDEHTIFKDFIDAERNAILKQYDFSTHPNEGVDVVIEMKLVNPETGETKIVHQIETLDENLFRPIVDRYGEGEDARDIYREAIEWWDRQLNSIDIEIAELRQ